MKEMGLIVFVGGEFPERLNSSFFGLGAPPSLTFIPALIMVTEIQTRIS
jgi:hypothetical protein